MYDLSPQNKSILTGSGPNTPSLAIGVVILWDFWASGGCWKNKNILLIKNIQTVKVKLISAISTSEWPKFHDSILNLAFSAFINSF